MIQHIVEIAINLRFEKRKIFVVFIDFINNSFYSAINSFLFSKVSPTFIFCIDFTKGTYSLQLILIKMDKRRLHTAHIRL